MPPSLSSNSESAQQQFSLEMRESENMMNDGAEKKAANPILIQNNARSSGKNNKRSLSLPDLIMIGMGNIIGSGIFTYSGIGAKSAGEAIFISWIISGLIASLTVFVFAELSSRIKKSGSSYIYAYIITGEFSAWQVSWSMFARYGTATAIQARAFGSYCSGMLAYNGFPLPTWIHGYEIFGYQTSLITIGFILSISAIVSRGS